MRTEVVRWWAGRRRVPFAGLLLLLGICGMRGIVRSCRWRILVVSLKRRCRVIGCSGRLVLLVAPGSLVSGIRLSAERRLRSSGAHLLLHVVFLHHGVLSAGVTAGQGSLPQLPFSELPLALLHFSFAHHFHLPLLALAVRHVSRVVVLDGPAGTLWIILILPAHKVLALRWSAHVDRSWRWDTGERLGLTVRPRYGVARHSPLLSRRLLRRGMRHASLRVGLGGPVALYLGCAVGTVWGRSRGLSRVAWISAIVESVSVFWRGLRPPKGRVFRSALVHSRRCMHRRCVARSGWRRTVVRRCARVSVPRRRTTEHGRYRHAAACATCAWQ